MSFQLILLASHNTSSSDIRTQLATSVGKHPISGQSSSLILSSLPSPRLMQLCAARTTGQSVHQSCGLTVWGRGTCLLPSAWPAGVASFVSPGLSHNPKKNNQKVMKIT